METPNGTAPGPLMRLAIRRRVRTELEAKKVLGKKLGVGRVNELMQHVDDGVIDDAFVRMNATPPVGGPITDWLRDNKQLIAQIVQMILDILL